MGRGHDDSVGESAEAAAQLAAQALPHFSRYDLLMMTGVTTGSPTLHRWPRPRCGAFDPRQRLALLSLAITLGLTSSAAAEPPLPPLPAGPGYQRLPVPGYLSAVVAWPTAAHAGALPIAVATHGSFDQPEWNCETYQQVVRGSAVVLCPRGKLRWDTPEEPEQRRYYFPAGGDGPQASIGLAREVSAAMKTLQAKFPTRLAAGGSLYIGFSQGAILGATIVIQDPARFPRAILVEGGHGAWNPGSARRFARGGGQRVLFACGRASCLASARVAAGHLTRAGVQAQVVYAEDQGHTYSGKVQEVVATAFDWVIAGDARFAIPAPDSPQ